MCSDISFCALSSSYSVIYTAARWHWFRWFYFSPVSRASGFYLVALFVALFWARSGPVHPAHRPDEKARGLTAGQYSRRYSGGEAEVPRHEKGPAGMEILRDDEVFRQQRCELTGLTDGLSGRGCCIRRR